MIDDMLDVVGALEDSEINLFEVALRLALLDCPDEDHEAQADLFEEMLENLVQEPLETVREQVNALALVFGSRYGFEGNRDDYDHPDNGNMIKVLKSRRGLPVTLAILYLSAARRMGWEADGLNIPGHFLIRIGPEHMAFVQDPFNKGAIISEGELVSLIEKATGEEANMAHVQPLNNRAILIRLLNNLSVRAEQADDMKRVLVLHERMTLIAPAFTALWWERARIEQSLGLIRSARSSLCAMLETTRDQELCDKIKSALDGLTRQLN